MKESGQFFNQILIKFICFYFRSIELFNFRGLIVNRHLNDCLFYRLINLSSATAE